ncbi:peptidoglycan-binding protein [Bacillus sp. V2I10]|uniref:peptidoglycan-binding domain-containing protein n=1 Tax=Bacillus sp. V2I10 TaxID=3042276 RepID=UPI00277F867E|nr:peptidoglycan-binding protein [Bacillus sp. V2I10]MDQ0858863.1 peptidoglycan hydrolase-like protein with peptidoglycan-binding domain [Bacillus sp. V2I10]
MNFKKSFFCLSAAGIIAFQTLPLTIAEASKSTQSTHEIKAVSDPYPGHVIKYGDRGPNVRKVQDRLNKNNVPIYVDGIFGQTTLKKVKEFQMRRHLKADGVVGPSTWTALYHTEFPYPGYVVKIGDRGINVTKIQARLNDAGGSIKVDGIFGPNTQQKVKEFQKKFGLKVDGIVGPETWDILFNYEE